MIIYTRLAKADIASIKPLWESLNRMHEERSANFKEHFAANAFERRIEKFLRLADDRLYIGAAKDSTAVVGYVVATASGDGTGEIDSIFVGENHRAGGVGRALMEGALTWLSENGCPTVTVGVADGNEETIGFYRRFGFYPRMTILMRRGEGGEPGP